MGVGRGGYWEERRRQETKFPEEERVGTWRERREGTWVWCVRPLHGGQVQVVGKLRRGQVKRIKTVM